LGATAVLVTSTGAGGVARQPITVATIRAHVNGFAQDRRYLAWTTSTRRGFDACDVVTFRSLATGRQVRIAPRHRDRYCVGPVGEASNGGLDLALADDGAYWTDFGGSNLTYYSDLETASASERRIRHLDYQSISNESLDVLVPPATDSRSAYWWSSPDDATPGPIVRYDRRDVSDLTPTVDSLRALAAGGNGFAYAPARWIFDCAQDPAWSPDGRSIALASYAHEFVYLYRRRSCRGGLWVVAADGKNAVRIGDGRSPDWSPDGTKLAYESAENIVVASADGSGQRTLTQGTAPAWSPDGRSIAFARGGSVYIVGTDGSGERLVAADAAEPDWSPDGTRLVVARTGQARGIAVVGIDGTGFQPLTGGYDSDPSWSPDGTTIAFASCWNGNLNCPQDTTVIATIAPDGSGRRELTGRDPEQADTAPAWAPDSQRLVFARQRGYQDDGDSNLWTRSAAGEHRLTRTPPPQTPVVVASRAGRRRARFEPAGTVTGLAVTSHVVAALTHDAADWRVEIFRPVRRTVKLPGATGVLSASDWTLVFNRGRTIYALDARRGSPRVVARAVAAPVGLSIVGRRIAWAENAKLGARIRALDF
jgi:TolB protein